MILKVLLGLAIFFCLNINFISSSKNCTTQANPDGTYSMSCIHTLNFRRLLRQFKNQTQNANKQNTVSLDEVSDYKLMENITINSTNSVTRNKRNSESTMVLSSSFYADNLHVMHQANMTDCLARLHCQEQCNYSSAKSKVDNHFFELEANQTDDDLPDYVKYFLESGRIGEQLGRQGIEQCQKCASIYKRCNELQYDYTLKTNKIYEDLIEKGLIKLEATENDSNVSSSIPEHLQFLHHSMEFLDLANLTQCYARIGCENTCQITRENPLIEPPPKTSPILAGDIDKPKSVDIIHNGSILGYNLAKTNRDCNSCVKSFPNCEPEKFQIAKMSSLIFN